MSSFAVKFQIHPIYQVDVCKNTTLAACPARLRCNRETLRRKGNLLTNQYDLLIFFFYEYYSGCCLR